MVKHYFQIFAVCICFFVTTLSHSQSVETKIFDNETIEGLTIYPNPVSNGKIYITSSKNLSKHIEIFDVLGKRLYNTELVGTALDISRLNVGVYIIKVTESGTTTTRKLVVK
jgi:hypothetical protein